MTSLQQEPSAQRPWAKTTVGFSDAGISLSVFAAGVATWAIARQTAYCCDLTPTPQELRRSMRRAIRRLRGATFRLGLRAASQLHSPGGSETEGVSLAASERRPGQLPLRRAFCLLARLCRRARLSILAGGAALESTLGSRGPPRTFPAPHAADRGAGRRESVVFDGAPDGRCCRGKLSSVKSIVGTGWI